MGCYGLENWLLNTISAVCSLSRTCFSLNGQENENFNETPKYVLPVLLMKDGRYKLLIYQLISNNLVKIKSLGTPVFNLVY